MLLTAMYSEEEADVTAMQISESVFFFPIECRAMRHLRKVIRVFMLPELVLQIVE